MNNWKLKKIDECAEVIGGGTPSTSNVEFWNGDIPWLTPKDLSGYSYRYIKKGERNISEEGLKKSSARLLPEGSVLFTSRAPIGYVAIAKNPVTTNQGFKSLVLKDNNVSEFFYYLLKNNKDYIESFSSGSTFKEISGGALKELKFNIPPPSEQKAIADILGSLDDKIELNRQMNKTLEDMAQAIFKSWFVDFDPVKAKAEGRTIEGLSQEIFDLFPDSFEESELGTIPKGYIIEPLDKIANYLNGLALQKFPPDSETEYLPAIKIAELKNGIKETTGKASTKIKPEYIIDDGDVIFSWSASLVVDIWCEGKGALNQHLFKVTSKDYPKWFYYFWTKYFLEKFTAIAADKATTMGHIKREHLTDAKVLIPCDKLINESNKIFEPLINEIIGLRVQTRTLSKMRDSLLPKLISGEIRVPEAEKFIEDRA